ncbi:hypothetical protein RvY_12717 [Ramazzottius varieornatus]|uniref:UMP-CMP kinase n=1 Tax=Ramazzottius varieornatus TaxID=947166 RepID=A0A1D1VMQ8_RAMVA|nr:hypothetical protein RvY_12717 [Ramazzottius varieornatus]
MSDTTKMSGDKAEVEDGMKPNVVFVLGAPGSGKGTQCSLITSKTNFVHLSAGDLLRQECATSGSQYGDLIASYIKDGKIVPVEITCSLLEKAMKMSGKEYFLIDGFPRNFDNLQGWINQMGHKTDFLFLLFLQAPEDICVERILSRGATSGRIDDNADSLKKRFQTYLHDTLPIVKFYEDKGLVRSVDSTRPMQSVHEDVMAVLREVVSKDGLFENDLLAH